MKKRPAVWIWALLILLTTHQVWMHVTMRRSTVSTMHLTEVWDGFDMKKELEEGLSQELKNKQRTIDSLTVALQQQDILAGGNGTSLSPVVLAMVRHKERLEQEYEMFHQQEVARLDQMIRERLSGYIEEFAASHRLGTLIAYENNHPVLYSDESVDLTQDIIAFINSKYSGK